MLHRPDTDRRLASLLAVLRDKARPAMGLPGTVVVFVSASDSHRRALVASGSGPSLDGAWQGAMAELRAAMAAHGVKGRWLRADWVDHVRPSSWGELRRLLSRTKRNYFRFGIALDSGFRHAFLEQELNANAMLYGGNTVDSAVLNERNFNLYARQRFAGIAEDLAFPDDGGILLFSTRGIFLDEAGDLHELAPPGLDAGRRHIPALAEADLLGLIKKGSAYLARQVRPDGSFVYGYHPCFDRRIDAYNTLRHASTTYAMIEAWEVTGDGVLKAAAERALARMISEHIRDVPLPGGEVASFLVDVGDEIKLGGTAVALLALTKWQSAGGSDAHGALMERLARGLCHMQDPATGAFVHVLDHPGLGVREPFRTIYYEGEAAFALMRLYDLTRDPRWLGVVEKAFGHFIASGHWKHHDHWLGYAANELTRHRPEERYFRFAIRNVADHLGFVENRITTFPTLLELMMAARETLSRMDSMPELHPLFRELDLRRFEAALEKRARYLLNGHFWPEMAMYFRKPDRIAGSFFIRHHAFRVRIDDVEHYLSGLVAYRKYLGGRAEFRRLVARHAHPGAVAAVPADLQARAWTAPHVEAATGGRWVRPPPPDWSAGGLCTYAPAARPGDLIVVRSGGERIGILPQVLPRLRDWSGILVADPGTLAPETSPLLQMTDAQEAVLAMGGYARQRMTGNVTAVTGSAGKTTMVAMLAHALSARGEVASSRLNANLPVGVACNLASMPWDVPHAVLELAVGRMAVSARMARPHAAVFTNILPAHLGERSTLADVARTKSAIFLGMDPGAVAIINRDMQEFELVREAARRRRLQVVLYGLAADCDVRLLDYDIHTGRVRASVRGQDASYRLGSAGRHMALNSLAVLATVAAYGHPLEPAMERLADFSALPGRGAELALRVGGKSLTVLDDAYNANPGSMKAALERLGDQRSSGRRIAVLGQMAELGPASVAYHTELAALIRERRIDRVYVTGADFGEFWRNLPPDRRGENFDSLETLKQALLGELQDGDTVLVKGSHSSRLHEIVAYLKAQAAG